MPKLRSAVALQREIIQQTNIANERKRRALEENITEIKCDFTEKFVKKEDKKKLKIQNNQPESSSTPAPYHIDWIEFDESLPIGSVVWADYGKAPYLKRYLGILLPSFPLLPLYNTSRHVNIYWFADKSVSKITRKRCHHFKRKYIYEEQNKKISISLDGISEAWKVICTQYNLPERKNIYTFKEFGQQVRTVQFGDCNYSIPQYILNKVEEINNHSVEIDPKDGSRSDQREIPEFSIDYLSRDPKNLCVGCRETCAVMVEHPLVKANLCVNCKGRVMKNCQILRLNQRKFKFCAICGWMDKHIDCINCKRVVCWTCIFFWMPYAYDRTVFNWLCIFCDDGDYKIKAHSDNHRQEEEVILEGEVTDWPAQEQIRIKNTKKGKPCLRVLSLFDGISSGLVALNKLGVKVEKYFASEIDVDAIEVTKAYHGEGVEHIGDVTKITSTTLQKYLPIHLVIGGSPCNDLSRVNPDRKGLMDMNGSGSLFFEFYRVMKLLENLQGSETFYYFYENVSSMKVEHKDAISRFFECSPNVIDAKFMSVMSRSRLYWGNIPQMQTLSCMFLEQTKDSLACNLQDYLIPNLNRKAEVKKIRTVTTNSNSLKKNDGSPQVTMGGAPSSLSVIEIENIFGFPIHYTDTGKSINKRRKLLGKSWCVVVIEAILRPLVHQFQEIAH